MFTKKEKLDVKKMATNPSDIVIDGVASVVEEEHPVFVTTPTMNGMLKQSPVGSLAHRPSILLELE